MEHNQALADYRALRIMEHKQALADYRALRKIACGEPHDAGEVLEQITERMLSRPTVKEATRNLCELVELYFVRGGPEQDSLRDHPQAQAIFVRHRLMSSDEE
jgi:hypothetical protein